MLFWRLYPVSDHYLRDGINSCGDMGGFALLVFHLLLPRERYQNFRRCKHGTSCVHYINRAPVTNKFAGYYVYKNIARNISGDVFICFCFELLTRIELVTSSLPRKCSTTELQQHFP